MKGHNFLVYDIYDIAKGEYLSPESRKDICNKYNIEHVPILWDSIGVRTFWMDADELIQEAYGCSEINKKKKREGLVFKSTSSSQKRISFKVISNSYLLGTKNV